MKLYVVLKFFRDGTYCRVDALFKTEEMAEKFKNAREKLNKGHFYEIEEKEIFGTIDYEKRTLI